MSSTLQQPQPPQPSQSSIHQQLLSLANSPFGENPLFKPLATDSNKRADILKPTNPAAQKALTTSLYKPSPHRNVKIRVKPNCSSDKSQIFEGLDDDLLTGETFVPRPSVKKLVLRSTPSGETSSLGLTGLEHSETRDNIDNSLTVGLQESAVPVKNKSLPEQSENINDSIPVDDSFAALNTRKRTTPEETEKEGTPAVSGSSGVRLTRTGYYTIPSLSQLALDTDSQCLVTGFTVGREGYGNIHFPATMNIANMDMDEIVHIRHKEVIVYPDDNKKPVLGEGLNRPAQITLDKVWPVCKSTGETISCPDRLKAMNYEEKLERASTRLGAKFIEYRPETGSWVFKVEHFSKYGLIDDDSDDELEIVPTEITQKMKTLEKRTETTMLNSPQVPMEVLDNNTKNIVLSSLDNSNSQATTNSNIGREEAEADGSGSDRDVDMTETLGERPAASAARSALFGDETEAGPVTKPVILQHRVSSIANISLQPRVIECVANTASLSRGLGGMSMLGTSNLSASYVDTSRLADTSSANASLSVTRSRTGKIPSYSLQGGYDKWVSLPSQGKKSSDQFTVFIPQHLDTELNLSNSFLSSQISLPLADLGLMMGKSSRAGWGRGWSLVSAQEGGKCLGSVTMSRLDQTSCGPMDSAQARSLEEWFRVALATSTRLEDGEAGGARFSAVGSIETLARHQAVAASQLDALSEASLEWARWTEMVHQTWSLMGALWGRVDHLTGEETVESHDISMTRRQAVTRWLESVVGDTARRDSEAAALSRSKVGGVMAELSRGDVSSACKSLQDAGDHRTALLASQLGGGGDTSRMMSHQLERWTEARADENISQERLKLFSLIAGCPVWGSSSGPVNTCSQLDWPRSLAGQLWYLTHPLASIPDALHEYELAWKGTGPHGPYCTGPAPEYCQSAGTVLGSQPASLDLRYLLLRLYCDRSTGLEELCDPASHTADRMDARLGWFVLRVLEVLGYRHISHSARERLHRDMASQAEGAGLWVWAVFVLQHIESPDRREEAVKAVIDRNIQQCDEEAERSLVTDLGVPLDWIAASRATLAKSRHNHHDHVENLILAKKWPEAHDVLVKEIAPDCIISQDYQYISR